MTDLVSEANVCSSIHVNDSRKFQEARVVEIVGDSELVTVAGEIVPFVNVDAILFVGYDLKKDHHDTIISRRVA